MTTMGVFPVTIHATPEHVWQWVGDLSRHAEWSPHHYTVECVAGQPNQVGSRYRSIGWIPGDKVHPNDVEILEVVPSSRLVLRADDKQGSFMNTYALQAVNGGTEVSTNTAARCRAGHPIRAKWTIRASPLARCPHQGLAHGRSCRGGLKGRKRFRTNGDALPASRTMRRSRARCSW